MSSCGSYIENSNFMNFKTANFNIHKIQIISVIAAKLQQTLRPKGSTYLSNSKTLQLLVMLQNEFLGILKIS